MDSTQIVAAVGSITVAQAIAWIVALAAAITGIGKAVDWIVSKRKKYPCAERMEMLANDKKRLDRLEKLAEKQADTSEVMLKSLSALITHEITGNSVDNLKDVQRELYEYLIKR